MSKDSSAKYSHKKQRKALKMQQHCLKILLKMKHKC